MCGKTGKIGEIGDCNSRMPLMDLPLLGEAPGLPGMLQVVVHVHACGSILLAIPRYHDNYEGGHCQVILQRVSRSAVAWSRC